MYIYTYVYMPCLYKNMYILNRLETNCRKSMIPFHALFRVYAGIFLLYNFNILVIFAPFGVKIFACKEKGRRKTPSEDPEFVGFPSAVFVGGSTSTFLRLQVDAEQALCALSDGTFSSAAQYAFQVYRFPSWKLRGVKATGKVLDIFVPTLF